MALQTMLGHADLGTFAPDPSQRSEAKTAPTVPLKYCPRCPIAIPVGAQLSSVVEKPVPDEFAVAL